MADRILIVDDEREISDLVEVYLKNEGFEVCKFYTAQEAWDCIQSTPLDLAILDLMLPGMDGFALCRSLRELGGNYPVIMLTAKDGEMDKITGLTLGADDYVTKPFRPLELVARVKPSCGGTNATIPPRHSSPTGCWPAGSWSWTRGRTSACWGTGS